MNDFDPRPVAEAWVEAWNRRDWEAVLSHYYDDITFITPIAAEIEGGGAIRGKEALRTYWQKALSVRPDVVFALDDVAWDATARLLSIFYAFIANGVRTMVCECRWFDEHGMVVGSAGLYGAAFATSSVGH